MKKFKCVECSKIYNENTLPEDYMCKDSACPGGGILGVLVEIPEENEIGGNISDGENYIQKKECGLCVLLMDASRSMFMEHAFKDNPLPSSYGNEYMNKAEMVSKAAALAIFSLKDMALEGNKEAHICAIKFDHRRSVMFNDTIKNIIAQHQDVELFAKYIYDHLAQMQGGTDINTALNLAHSYIEKFKNGTIPGMGDYTPHYQQEFFERYNKSEWIPNIRTLIYTDGDQQKEYGPIQSPFSGGIVDLLMGAYIGKSSESGCGALQEVLSDCPQHGQRQFFIVDGAEKSKGLRGLFRMASGTSGFCPQCKKIDAELH